MIQFLLSAHFRPGSVLAAALLLLIPFTPGFSQTVLAEYKFENNLNAEAGAIGSPSLTFSSTENYNAGVTGVALSSTTNNAFIELTLNTTGYTGIQVGWAGRTSNNTAPTGQWVLTGNSGSGYGTALHTQSLTTTFANTGFISLAAAFNNNSVVKLKITITGNTSSRNLRIDDLIVRATAAACTPPTTQPSGFSSANVLSTQTDISFTRGNGTGGVLVLARAGSAVNSAPQSGTTYLADSEFGFGDEIGTGNFVVYNGVAAGASTATGNFTITGLTSGETYHFAAYEYATTGTCYQGTSPLTGNVQLPCTTPTAVSGAGIVADNGQVTLSWTNTTCWDEILVVVRAGSAVSATPSGDGSAYTADAVFGNGTALSAAQHAAYKGTGNSVIITGLTNGTTYHTAIFSRKGTTWSAGVSASGTPSIPGYYWNGGSTAANPANGGSGTWGTTNTWRQPSSTGAQATWSNGNNAIFAGTAGTVTLDGDRTPTAVYVNTSGYTFRTTSTTARLINGPIVLAQNAVLNLSPNVNTGSPANGVISVGNISGSGSASITLQAAESNSASQRVNLSVPGATISVPTTIVSMGGTGTNPFAGYVADATNTQLAAAATITNNSPIRTVLGATSGNSLTVNSVVTGSAGLQFAAGVSGGAGTVVLNAQSTYTGTTLFNMAGTGVVRLGIDNALPEVSDVTLAATTSNGGIFDLNGFNQAIASLSSGAGNGSITNNSTTADATLTISGSATTSFARPITDGTRKVALTRSGTGSLTLTGVNTYTGLTTVSGGTLALANSANTTLPSSSNITVNGGTLEVNANQTVNTLTLNGGTVTIASGKTLTINGVLTLTNGHILVGSGNLVIGGTITGGDLASHIVTNGSGALTIKNVTSAGRTFPVGVSAASFDPATLTPVTTTDIAVRVSATFSNAVLDVSKVVEREWDITPVTPGSTQLALTHDASLMAPAGTYVIGHYLGVWTEGSVQGVAYDPGTRTFTGTVSTFSPLAGGTATGFGLTPFPVELVSFEAVPVQGSVVLNWITASETNNAYFAIERSANNADFEVVGEIAGAGNSQQDQAYTFTDTRPAPGKNYYRLRQTDQDGSFTFSETREVNMGTATGLHMYLKANPATERAVIEIVTAEASPAILHLYDLKGTLLSSTTLALVPGTQVHTFPVTSLAAGTYQLVLECNGAQQHTTMMVR